MGTRYLHLLFVMSVLAAVVGFESFAWAGAPYCDPQAITGNAPAPVLAVADVRLEQDESIYWGACEKISSLLQGSAPNPNEQPNTSVSSQTEYAIPVVNELYIRRVRSRRVLTEIAQTRGPNGYPPGVFRPPRAGH